MRGITLVILSTAITGAAAFFMLQKDAAFQGKEQGASIGGLPKTTPLSEIELLPHPPLVPPLLSKERGEGGRGSDQNVAVQLELASNYLNEALPIIAYNDRFVLIDKINGFNNNYEFAAKLTGSDPVNLKFVISATARYIATWSPFYYYIHPDAQSVLGPIIKTLERNRMDMLKEFVKQDARRAGELAAKDIEYYIEDIRKSAARRNSDFITFSFQDYEGYRKTFDDLVQSRQEFLFGFAESAHILFDDFYRMHEEVDSAYLEKTRKKVLDMRLELRDLHKRALLELAQHDKNAAQSALTKTISTIESELALHVDWRAEVHDIMKFDYEFYKDIQF